MSTCQYELNCWPCYRRHDSLSRLVPWSMTANRINSLEIFILSRNSNVSFFPGNCFGCFLLRYHSDSRWWRHLLTLPLLQFGVEHGTSVTHLQRERDIEYQWKKQQLKNNRLSLASIHFLLFIGIFDFFFAWKLMRCHWSDRITWCGPLHTPSIWTGFSEFEGRSSHQRCVQHLCQSWWCACQMLND